MYFLHLILGKKLDICDIIFFFLSPAYSLYMILRGKSEFADVKTFFWSSPDFARKIYVCGRENFLFFFGLHLILRGKLDVCEREDLFFCSSLDFWRNIYRWRNRGAPPLFFQGGPNLRDYFYNIASA